MRVVYPDDEQNKQLAWLMSERMGGGSDAQCLAIMDDSGLVGIVGFFNYRWPNIEMCFYCDDYRWALNRKGVHEVLTYPFKQLDCRRVTALVERKNKIARKMVKGLGFKEEGMLRKAGPKGDIFIYGLLPDDFALRQYHESTSTTASA